MSRQWFDWYTRQTDKEKSWPRFRERFLCPCCFMPTLEKRAVYDICPICFWEDDGQDSDDADIARGGPNADYSLTEARNNFSQHHTMLRPADSSAFQSQMEKMVYKKAIYNAHQQAIRCGSDSDWNAALAAEEAYYQRNC